MSKDTGGPAFPFTFQMPDPGPDDGKLHEMTYKTFTYNGMSLRDYFAAAALTGYRCGFWQWYRTVGSEGKFPDPSQMAQWSYADADALLAERAK